MSIKKIPANDRDKFERFYKTPGLSRTRLFAATWLADWRGFAIDQHVQRLADLEERNGFRGDANTLAGARVTAGTGFAVLDGKHAKAAQFDTLATCHGGGDLVEYSRNHFINVALQ